jgi:hypothetical protein
MSGLLSTSLNLHITTLIPTVYSRHFRFSELLSQLANNIKTIKNNNRIKTHYEHQKKGETFPPGVAYLFNSHKLPIDAIRSHILKYILT